MTERDLNTLKQGLSIRIYRKSWMIWTVETAKHWRRKHKKQPFVELMPSNLRMQQKRSRYNNMCKWIFPIKAKSKRVSRLCYFYIAIRKSLPNDVCVIVCVIKIDKLTACTIQSFISIFIVFVLFSWWGKENSIFCLFEGNLVASF